MNKTYDFSISCQKKKVEIRCHTSLCVHLQSQPKTVPVALKQKMQCIKLAEYQMNTFVHIGVVRTRISLDGWEKCMERVKKKIKRRRMETFFCESIVYASELWIVYVGWIEARGLNESWIRSSFPPSSPNKSKWSIPSSRWKEEKEVVATTIKIRLYVLCKNEEKEGMNRKRGNKNVRERERETLSGR